MQRMLQPSLLEPVPPIAEEQGENWVLYLSRVSSGERPRIWHVDSVYGEFTGSTFHPLNLSLVGLQ